VARKDPIERQERRLAALGVDVEALRAEVRATIDAASEEALAMPMPDPESATARVFADEAGAARGRRAPVERLPANGTGEPPDADDDLPSGDLDGLREEMRADEVRVLHGRGHRAFGGAFKVTDGSSRSSGRPRDGHAAGRVGIVGTAIGAAVVGMRPVCEMQFSDFISCGFDQLVNVAGKMHYRQGLAGADHGAAAERRRILRRARSTRRTPRRGSCTRRGSRWWRRPTAEDAEGSAHLAIRDPNPVCFMEHKHLYRRIKGEVAEGTYETPLAARVAREGTDLVVITYGAMVHTALEATADLDGASVEVLDLRSLGAAGRDGDPGGRCTSAPRS
jgi:hypothetical protein